MCVLQATEGTEEGQKEETGCEDNLLCQTGRLLSLSVECSLRSHVGVEMNGFLSLSIESFSYFLLVTVLFMLIL